MPGVFTVRATKKLLDRCGGVSRGEPPPSTTVLGDWYATVLFWRPQVALFVNEATRLPVFVPLAPGATVVERFVGQVALVFVALGLDPRFVDAEMAQMSEHRVAKTASRSVVGTMNDFAFLAEAHRDHGDAQSLVVLSARLAGTPCGPLRASTGFPDLEVRALVAQIPGLS
jgi:hypothetical protein